MRRFEQRGCAAGRPIAGAEHRRYPTKVVASGLSWVTAIDAEKVGLAALALGAGRVKKEDAIDPAAWVRIHKKGGERVEPGEAVAEVAGRGDISDDAAGGVDRMGRSLRRREN